jgi:hypothetical protein
MTKNAGRLHGLAPLPPALYREGGLPQVLTTPLSIKALLERIKTIIGQIGMFGLSIVEPIRLSVLCRYRTIF